MSQDILVVVEHLDNVISDVTFELLGKGRELATATGGKLLAAVLTSSAQSLAEKLGVADQVIGVEDPQLQHFNPESYLTALSSVVEKKAPRLVLIANTSMGMDLGASLSVERNLPLVAYAADVEMEGDAAIVTSHLYGGKIYSESVLDADSGIVSILAGSFPAEPGKKDGTPELEILAAPPALSDTRLRFKSLIQPEAGDVDITQEDILVAVGRGIQSEDNLPLAEELAKALGGAVCSSRPIVDNKWLEKNRQVGKSGLKVKPRVYIALGISGAPEHIEGMKDAELIVAINTDETAPIFEHAHYGVTEDLFDIVPALTEKLK